MSPNHAPVPTDPRQPPLGQNRSLDTFFRGTPHRRSGAQFPEHCSVHRPDTAVLDCFVEVGNTAATNAGICPTSSATATSTSMVERGSPTNELANNPPNTQAIPNSSNTLPIATT